MSNYGIDDIKSLDFREGVRTRIQMYLGSDDLEGTYQAFKEIINNSTDEALAGYGRKIEIEVSEKNNCISVRDYGRGVPFGIRNNGENVLVSIYSKSHTGGKFDDKVYKNSSGLNGIGAKCVCLSSKVFKVESYRNKTRGCAVFNEGILESYKEDSCLEEDGTYVCFVPDEKVFKNGEIGYSFDRICNDIRDISYLYKGITFSIKNIDTNVVKRTHSISYYDGISTIKDFRAVFHTFIKGAMNVYQILYTPYVSVNEKYRKHFDCLRSMADDITSNNQRYIIYSTLGVIRSNLASITRVGERILSQDELGKRFAMSFYYREFIERFMDGESFGSAMVTQNADYLKRLKRWKVDSLLYSIDDMEKWADNFADQYSLLDGNELRLQELQEELDTLSLEIMEGKDYDN